MHRVLYACLVAVVGLATAQTSLADLIVTITGTPGSGETTWTFSGSAISGPAGGSFLATTDVTTSGIWADLGEYTAVDDFESTTLSGSGTITVNGSDSRPIGFGYIDDDGVAGGDDFAVTVTGSDLAFADGDTVSWTGSIVTDIDLNDFNDDGVPPATLTTTNFNGIGGTLALQINIVPEPASASLLGLGLAAIARRGRRRA